MSEQVIVTGRPGGQCIVYFGLHVTPGSRVKMTRKEAEAMPRDVLIVDEVPRMAEAPKPQAKLDPDEVAKRVKAAESGRIERGGQKRD